MSPKAGKPPVLPIFRLWSRRANHSIFKVKRSPEEFSWTFIKKLVIELVGPDGKFKPFSWSNEPRAEFRCDFCQKFSWTSVKTLDSELVGPNGQTNPFSRSNDPEKLNHSLFQFYRPSWSRWANWPIFKVKRAQSRQTPFLPIFRVHSPSIFGDPKFQRDLCQKFSMTSVKTPIIEPVSPDEQTGPFSSKLVLMGKPSHFQGRTIPEQVNPLFATFFHAIVHGFLVIRNFDLLSQLVLTGKSAHFQVQMSPIACKPLILPIIHML
ncbi:hypothetical protein H5410_042193 [Solanum commersonii]|uniref:Uncharacterized protein n=1 Tax=Solanum commersonii TaxID=4109 RepID=A0A9J5XVP7_SOLCO|nr:hypothetical protein H5410_042193 [Solanum commersonii]